VCFVASDDAAVIEYQKNTFYAGVLKKLDILNEKMTADYDITPSGQSEQEFSDEKKSDIDSGGSRGESECANDDSRRIINLRSGSCSVSVLQSGKHIMSSRVVKQEMVADNDADDDADDSYMRLRAVVSSQSSNSSSSSSSTYVFSSENSSTSSSNVVTDEEIRGLQSNQTWEKKEMLV